MNADSIQPSAKLTAPEPRIAAVIATYKRPETVARLIGSCVGENSFETFCVVDNGSDPTLRSTLEALDKRVRYVDAGSNLGCGGGLALGIKTVMPDSSITHFWILDDDAVLEPSCATTLLNTMRREGADLAVPFIYDPKGNIGSFPGPLRGPAWREIKKAITPDQFVRACGSDPRAITWSPGVCVLITRRAVEQCGLPRSDYWLMGEDIEYTSRISDKFQALLVPAARAHHLPPPAKIPQDEQTHRYAFVKFCAHLTNNTYTAVVLRHGRKLLRHLPGNYLRFLHENHWSPQALFYAARCFVWGAIFSQPAGSKRFQAFRAKALRANRK